MVTHIAAPQPRMFLVYDEQDRVEHVRYAQQLHALNKKRLVVAIRPGTSTLHQLGADLLDALGKRIDVSARSTTANETWFRAYSWMIGEQIEHVIVCRAHLLAPLRTQRLLEAATVADATLWLLIHRPSLNRGQRDLARDWDLPEISLREFRRRWHDPPGDAPHAISPAPFPDVPDDEAPSFLSSCRELLGPAEFDRVSQSYRHAQQRTAAWLREHDSPDDDTRQSAFERWMHEQISGCADLPEVVTVARAIQAAALWDGLWIKVNKDKLAGAFTHTRLARLDDAAVTAIRRYSHPRYAASAVCSLASELPASAIAAMNIADIADDARTVTLAGRSYAVPPDARGALRAQRALRLLEGAQAMDPLFVSEKRLVSGRQGRQFGRTTAHAIQQSLQRMAVENGLSLVVAEDRAHHQASRSLRRHGITVHRLT